VERDHQLAMSGMRFEPLLRSQISCILAQCLTCLIGNLRPQDPTLLKWLARDERSGFFRILACLQHHRQFGTHCDADQQLQGKLLDFPVHDLAHSRLRDSQAFRRGGLGLAATPDVACDLQRQIAAQRLDGAGVGISDHSVLTITLANTL
jgi:hypothetical protein